MSAAAFVSSILEHEIVALDDAGHQQLFAESPDHWPVLALKVDSKRRRLWATEVGLQDFSSVAAADWGRSVLLEYDLDRGTLLARHDRLLRSAAMADPSSFRTMSGASPRSTLQPDRFTGCR
jgi:hypothetical protein